MNSLRPFHSLRLAALGLLSVAALAQAQVAAPDSSGPTEEKAIELSPFQVSAGASRGYAASETMTGSRVKTQIIDLPYTVNVLTSEFFEDFGIFEFSDNITQIGSFGGLDVGGNFNLRGFTSSYQLRDGFFRLGRYGASNIDRLEIIKGSNAAIYGRTSPGGMINMISKSPKPTPNQKLTLNYGDYNTQRVTVESTGPLGLLGNTNYILTASYYQRDFDQDYARNRNQEYYLAVDHTFADASKLTLSIENFAQLRHAPLAAVPLVIDQRGTSGTADDVAVGYALNLGHYNPHGPTSELNRANTSLTAVYDKKLNSVFSTRISGNFYEARRWDFNQNNGWGAININPPVATTAISTLRGATPNRTRIFEDGGGVQADLLAHYWTNNRKLEHRTLVTVDFNDYYRWDPALSYAGSTNPDIVAWNAVRRVTLDSNYNPVGPIPYFTKHYTESPGEIYTRNQRRRVTVLGALLRHQSSLLNGDLLAYAGARFDAARFRHTDFFTPASSFTSFYPGYTPGTQIRKGLTAFKPNLGVNYKIKENFRVFANYSESYFVSQGDTTLIVASPDYKPETAEGWDYGFKGSFFDDRLSYTISGYYAKRHNVTVTDYEETPLGSGSFVQVQRRDGDQLVRGYEADLNWRVTDEFSLLFSYGNVNSRYTNFGSAFPDAIGRRVAFIAPYNGSLSAKWAPVAGRLKGFSVNAGITFVGATPTELPTAGDTYATTGPRIITASTGQKNLRAPAYSLVSVGARYTLQNSGAVTHTFAVNVNNLLDEDYLRVGASAANRLLGEKLAVYFTYTLNFKGPKL
ncbi:MAG: TonB-dependent receptor [Opitutus sp.]